MRATFILLLIVLFNIQIIYSQYDEVVYLKNGSIIKGKIIELKPNEYLKFKTFDGNLWVFAYSDIEKFDMERNDVIKFRRDSLRKSYLFCDAGFLIGTVTNDMKAPFSFLTTYNFQLVKSLYFGIGTGLEFFQMTYIPLIADIRISPANTNVSFYFQGGLTFPMNEKGDLQDVEYKFKRGFLINPGISYTFSGQNSNEFVISIGYRYQVTDAERVEQTEPQYYYPYYSDDYSIITRLNRFSLRFGYRFK
jgi:hypothetical protein